mgnify:CR=1 FL=1
MKNACIIIIQQTIGWEYFTDLKKKKKDNVIERVVFEESSRQ